MDAHFSETLEEFMGSALVTWVHLFDGLVDGDGPTQYLEVNSNPQDLHGQYLQLTNGIFLNEVMRVIDPNPKVERISRNEGNDDVVRVQNFSILNRHLRSYYQEELLQLILMPLPNVAVLGRDPLTEASVEELRRLLLLLLGCAVQCERKQEFIQQIQSLDLKTQAAIATCIQEVTQDPSSVLPLQWGELCMLKGDDLQGVFSSMAQQIQALLAQRDVHLERIAELCRERESAQGPDSAALQNGYLDAPPQGLTVQLADSRAKLRRLRQELEDRDDQLLDYKQEVQAMEAELKKMRQENRTLHGEARVSRGLRDEMDCLRERAARADRLQSELQSCAHRLRSLDLYRTQLQEQQQYCATLQQTRALLEDQLGEARARCSSLRELERDNLLLRQRLIDLEAERDTERQRVDELLEVNMGLEAELKHNSGQERKPPPSGLESDDELSYETDLKPLSEEVSEASSLRLLGAEKENMELRRRLEQVQAEREVYADRGESAEMALANPLEEKQTLKEELQRETYTQMGQETKQQETLKEVLQRETCTQMGLETKQQETLKELQKLKNENRSLRNSLEALRKNLHDGLRQELAREEKSQPREEGEGGMEKREVVAGTEEVKKLQSAEKGAKREDREGEEILGLKEGKEEIQELVKNAEKSKQSSAMREEGESEKWTGELKKERERDGRGKTEGEEEHGREEGNGERGDPGPDATTLVHQLQQALLEVERQSEEVDRQAGLAQELRSRLGEQSRRAAGAEQRLSMLEAENARLRKAAESLSQARKQIEVLQSESEQMEEELARLRSQAEIHRLESVVLTQLQGEQVQLERERDALRGTVDSLRVAVRKGDQLELANRSLKVEVERMGRSLESLRRREEELQAELREAGLVAETLGRGRDQAVLEASRLEQEKDACQSELDTQRREQRQREREAARLRQQLESTASALEHSNQRTCSLEAENRRLCQELSQLQEDCAQMKELEKENKQLQEDCTQMKELEKENKQLQEDCAQMKELEKENKQLQALKIQLSALSQELANEKTQSQELANQVAELLQKMEILKRERQASSSSGSEMDTGSQVPPGATNKQHLDPGSGAGGDSGPKPEPPLLSECQIPEAKVLTGVGPHPGQETDRDHTVKLNEKNSTQKNNTPSAVMLPNVLDNQESQSRRLIEMERQKAALQTERDVLLSRLSQSQSACADLQEQLDSLQRHSISLQQNCANLQALNTKLQMEHVALSSQHALVWERCSGSEARVAAMEAESKVWAREREEAATREGSLRRDHERLSALQHKQEAELEALITKHSILKTSNRNLETQYRDLEGRYQELLECKAQFVKEEEVVRAERERMEREVQKQAGRERELELLREENERLHSLQKESMQVQTELLSQGSILRAELSAAQLERTRLEGELSTLREQNQKLDLNNSRLTSQYQLLTQLKGNMEEETRHLVEQNQNLARENWALLERSLESRDQHHQQQREYIDKLNELRREKQKLVEKIMDQYRVLEPIVPLPSKAKKSNWIADRMKKLIKPRTGREGREGRAQFIAAGSVENLADACDNAHSSPATPQDPRSGPSSPTPFRRAPGSLPEAEDQARVTSRTTRRKLGSRHGWGVGRGKLGGVSQSFSPGDHHPVPRDRFRSHDGATVIWEGYGSSTPSQESLTEEGNVEGDECPAAELHSDTRSLSSGAEDCSSGKDKKGLAKAESLQST